MCDKCNFYKKQVNDLKLQRYIPDEDIIKLNNEIAKLKNTIKFYLKKIDLIKQVIGCKSNKIITKIDESSSTEDESE